MHLLRLRASFHPLLHEQMYLPLPLLFLQKCWHPPFLLVSHGCFLMQDLLFRDILNPLLHVHLYPLPLLLQKCWHPPLPLVLQGCGILLQVLPSRFSLCPLLHLQYLPFPLLTQMWAHPPLLLLLPILRQGFTHLLHVRPSRFNMYPLQHRQILPLPPLPILTHLWLQPPLRMAHGFAGATLLQVFPLGRNVNPFLHLHAYPSPFL